MLSRKSVLARLLANENISVQQGNFETAFFDVENRVLGLPLWKEMSGDLYDLLVGHEVGHALYTPSTKEELQVKGVPFSYVNVVEDIRIEKAMLAKYPGLVANFKRGYLELVEMNIFGTKKRDINSMGFMDRLNIKAKGRDLIDVQFSDEEMPYFKMAMAVETFQDVENVCRALVAWLSQKKDDKKDENGQGEAEKSPVTLDQLEDIMSQLSMPGEESEEEGKESEEETDSGESENSASGEPEIEESEEESDKESEEEKSVAGAGAGEVPDDLPEVETEDAQRSNMKNLAEDKSKLFIQGMTRAAFELVKTPYKDIIESREARQKEISDLGGSEFVAESMNGYDDFMNQTKQVVNLMAKEFEMRKAAFRSARARTSTKGSLDVNKLHAYKYDDQLFKQVTTLADGKNHGMMMLVDYSGSMSNVLPSVIRQTIALVMFCKRVNIPFEVYAFTTSEDSARTKAVREASSKLVRFDYEDLALNQLFTNKMSKMDFERAMKSFYAQTNQVRYLPRIERLGSTPLNAALLATQYLIEDFLKVNPVHKMNLITLTDGESDPVRSVAGIDGSYSREYMMEIKGKKINLEASYWGEHVTNTKAILEAVTGPNITTANFFICSRRDFKKELYRVLPYDVRAQNEARKSMTKDGVWIKNDCNGYNRRFVIVDSSNKMTGQSDDFEIAEKATANQIAKAFSKFSGSKKGNRVVTQKFAELVA
tara:strand:+ start:372 stop:2504 length:2133 start_codon:yes stop_codon:yes gene_type:complete